MTACNSQRIKVMLRCSAYASIKWENFARTTTISIVLSITPVPTLPLKNVITSTPVATQSPLVKKLSTLATTPALHSSFKYKKSFYMLTHLSTIAIGSKSCISIVSMHGFSFSEVFPSISARSILFSLHNFE